MCKPSAGCCPGHTSSGSSGLLAVLGASAVIIVTGYVVAEAIAELFPVIVASAVALTLVLTPFIIRNPPRRYAHISHPGAFLETERGQAQLAIRQRNRAWNRQARALRPARQARALPASPAQRPAIPAPAPPVLPGYITGTVLPDTVPVPVITSARHGRITGARP